MKRRFGLSAAIGLSFATAPACEPTATPGVPIQLTSDEYKAAYRIAVARCDRQTSSCDPFPSRKACLDAKLVLTAKESRLLDCARPVDPSRLERCVAVVRRGECGTGIAHVDACRAASLCPDPSESGAL